MTNRNNTFVSDYYHSDFNLFITDVNFEKNIENNFLDASKDLQFTIIIKRKCYTVYVKMLHQLDYSNNIFIR
jgi:hypothetical protein